MTKREVLDAINATITSNNMNGITAQSLNNVLTMMVENAGEGGNNGSGSSDDILTISLLPNILNEDILDAGFGGITAEAITEDDLGFSQLFEPCYEGSNFQKELLNIIPNNMQVYQKLVNSTKSHLVVLDNRAITNAFIETYTQRMITGNPDLPEEVFTELRENVEMELPAVPTLVAYYVYPGSAIGLSKKIIIFSPIHPTLVLPLGAYILTENGEILLAEYMLSDTVRFDINTVNGVSSADLNALFNDPSILNTNATAFVGYNSDTGKIYQPVEIYFKDDLLHFTIVENKQFAEYTMDSTGKSTKIE
jgi:hypothetical protein